jgi:hypothetical protein
MTVPQSHTLVAADFMLTRGTRQMSMTLAQFERKLRQLVPETGMRPFVCEGSPLCCKVFIVGVNPATPGEFWKYWSTQGGFDKESWFSDYTQIRRAQGKRAVTPTRGIIERVVTNTGVPCLETNIYSVPTVRISDLPKASRSTDVFEFVLRSIRPKVVVLHGKSASLELFRIFGQNPAENEFHMNFRFGKVFVLCNKHFSRGWSFERADELGHRIRKLLNR